VRACVAAPKGRAADAAARSDAGGAPTAAEAVLRDLLLAHRLLLPSSDGRLGGAAGSCLLSIPRGLPRAEAADTLLHEAMHGLYYAHPSFAASVRAFWASRLSDEQRAGWRSFLTALGYDCSNEELVVNEFQAYMATERQLFGGGRGGGGGGGRGVAPGGEAAQAALRATQAQFAAALAAEVPAPAPRVGGCSCLFAAAGPFRLSGKKNYC